jgi:hypothetical protein
MMQIDDDRVCKASAQKVRHEYEMLVLCDDCHEAGQDRELAGHPW